MTLAELDAALERAGRYYPPAPTFTGAFVGGIVATNAAGAATFKYGTTRDWVEALTVVLPTVMCSTSQRGAARAHPDGYFELALCRPHRSRAGAALPDAASAETVRRLFRGAGDGSDRSVDRLRRHARHRHRGDAAGPDGEAADVPRVRAVQRSRRGAGVRRRAAANGAGDVARRRSVAASTSRPSSTWTRAASQLLREDGADRANGVDWADGASIALLVTLELPSETTSARAFDEIGRARESGRARHAARPLLPDARRGRRAGRRRDRGALATARVRRSSWRCREAVPAAVNQRVGRAKQSIDPRIEKTAADMIVPFERFEELLDLYDAEFSAAWSRRRGLGAHLGRQRASERHPAIVRRRRIGQGGDLDVRPRSRSAWADRRSPNTASAATASSSSCSWSCTATAGIDEMRAVKRAIDPEWKLAPGVLFERH